MPLYRNRTFFAATLRQTITLCLLLLLSPRYAAASDFALLADVPTAVHIKKPGSVKFHKMTKLRDVLERLGAPESATQRMPAELPTFTHEFSSYTDSLPSGAGAGDFRPACEKSAVRNAPVLVDSEELKHFDMLFYDYNDQSQARKSEAWPRPTVPWLEGDLYNPYRDGNLQQNLGRFFDIRCLPTRFHYPMVNGVRVEQYREGERAWDKDPEQ